MIPAQPQVTQPAAKAPSTRTLVAIFAVVVTVVAALGAIVYWEFGHACVDCGVSSGRHIGISVSRVNNNWTLLFTSVPPTTPLTNAFLTIEAANGSVIMPMDRVPLSSLTSANFFFYRALYEKVGANETDVAAGDQLLIHMPAYIYGYWFWIQETAGVLASGRLP